MPTLRFDGPTLEEAVEAAKRQLGPAPKIVAATRVRKGGVGGFFAREHVEVEVEVDGAGGSRRPSSTRPASRAPRENQGPRTSPSSGSSGPAPSQLVSGAIDGPMAGSMAGQPKAAEPRRAEAKRAEPRRAETKRAEPRGAGPRAAKPHWTDEGSGLSDNDDPMSALIEEMADNGPSSVLDLAEKINSEEGHFSLAADGSSQRGSSRGSSRRQTLGRDASGGERSENESAGRETAERKFPSDALAEREPIGPVARANVPRSGSRSEDRREEKKSRRWRQTQPGERAGEQAAERPAEQAVEQDWDGPDGAKQTPSTGFAAVLERIAREAGLATPVSDGREAAFRAPEPPPASHADLILTELADPLGLAAPRTQGAPGAPRVQAVPRGTAEPRATTTVDLAEPRASAAPAARSVPREWTEPLWLPAAGERGEPRWLAAPAVLARLSQAEPKSAPQSSPQPAPEPTPLAAALPERRLSQAGSQPAHQSLSQPLAQPAWLAPIAPATRLPQPAATAGSLVPVAPVGHLSELGLALQSLGVPIQACSAVTPTATRETIEGELRRALDLALPPLPAAPRSPSSVVVVVGPPKTVMSTARGIARDLGASPDEVALATQRKVWRKQDRVILSAEVAIEERRSWRWRDHPSVVAIEQDVRPERSAWTTEILQALEPTLCWGVAKASHKPEDLAAWSEALGGLDVLALVELDSTTTPAAALAAPIPVGSLDGEPATPALWATLLCARLMG